MVIRMLTEMVPDCPLLKLKRLAQMSILTPFPPLSSTISFFTIRDRLAAASPAIPLFILSFTVIPQ